MVRLRARDARKLGRLLHDHMIATLDKEWDTLGKPFMTRGSMGQDVIHPLI